MDGRYDPDVAALLVVAEAQVEVSRSILAYLARRGLPDTELVGLHAELDQLQAGVADASRRLLLDDDSPASAGG